jgi:hypothetical protein
VTNITIRCGKSPKRTLGGIPVDSQDWRDKPQAAPGDDGSGTLPRNDIVRHYDCTVGCANLSPSAFP